MTEVRLAETPPAYLHLQFDDAGQQRRAQTLGMWIFLATEAMMFGGLFLSYTMYRWLYPEAFVAGSHMQNLAAGSINTFLLILSSLTIALAGPAAREGRKNTLLWLLAISAVLGLMFLAIKGYEWHDDFVQGRVPAFRWTYLVEHPERAADLAHHGVTGEHLMMFYLLYFFMVGLHALHLTIGVGLVGTLFLLACRGQFTHGNHHPIEIAGLYWHFVDIVWVFLYPLFYLPGAFRGP